MASHLVDWASEVDAKFRQSLHLRLPLIAGVIMRIGLSSSRLLRYAILCSTAIALSACTTPARVTTATPAPSAVARSPAATALHALFDAQWADNMQRYPEWATSVGDNRHGDRLGDASAEAEAERYALVRQWRARAKAIDPSSLDVKDRTSLLLFVDQLDSALTYEPLVGYRRMSLGALFGFHTDFAELLRASPTRNTRQVEQILARMAAYPQRVDQELVRLRQGLSLGWVPPRQVLDRVLSALDGQLDAEGEKSPYFEPFTRLGSDVPADQHGALRQRALESIAQHVLPAQRRLRDFVAGEYAAATPATGALGSYPGGAAVYATAVRTQTTTDLTPRQIHDIGLREVARLRTDIDQVMKDMAWTGDFKSFVAYLNTDPQFFYTSGEALLAAYRDIGKRLDAEMPRLFAELPRLPWGVRAMPSAAGPDAIEHYSEPALDGSRPGWFNANAAGYKTRPKWGMETLTAHEAVPGHHLQVARAIELGQLPQFRRSGGYVAYTEGWGLYAETLGFQLGLYKEPASRFGHFQWQMMRAARLVVDTGIHDQGWPRQRAIDYMIDNTGREAAFIGGEVDRYISWPGQALGYMIGQLKIQELRDRARAKLGERFDIRRFHMAVLDQGAVPLWVLEQLIDDWVAEEAKRR